MEGGEIQVGDLVEAYWPDTDEWLPASLAELLEDGSLRIVWAEDASKSTVPADYVRSPESHGGELVPEPVPEPAQTSVSTPLDPLPEASRGRSPLKRLRGAQRDLKPAWMTKGLGVGTAMFGEATGELIKPGMTRKDLEDIERGDRNIGPDPFGDVFCESSSGRAAVAQAGIDRQNSVTDELLTGEGGSSHPSADVEECGGGSPEPVLVHDGDMLSFDGTGGIDVPHASAHNPRGSFSVHFWTEPQGGTGYRSPLTSRDSQPQRGYSFFITPNGNWSFWIGLPETKEWLKVDGPRAPKDEWQRLLGTYCDRERVLRLFVNGEKVGEKFAPGRPRPAFGPNTIRPLRIGAGATESEAKFHFVGAVADVRVYSRALSESEALLAGCDGDDGLPPAKRTC